MSNLLEHEESPYLLQHKNNPIYWYPWCDAAFTKAKEQNKTIFISIGYSTCHWCHVMEREVFEDEVMATFMNENFICIKVDKEERPDIDTYYQNVYQALNNKAGGWPTSIFCTSENSPFFAGTYIPLEPKYNIVGFRDLTQVIHTKVSTNEDAFVKNIEEVQQTLHKETSTTMLQELDVSIQEKFITQCKNNFEPTYGGFTTSRKFPQVFTLNAMISIYEFEKDDEIKSMITHTMDNMIAGGFYDLIDGGFCRYSVDAEWLVPHFEKMTYDNGLLCKLYLRAFKSFKIKRYLEVAQEIGSFMQKFMMQDSYLYSASDADTDGVEGEYFVYSRSEVLNAIRASGYEDKDAKKMTMRLLVSNSGNFEGKNIIHFANIQKEEWFESVKLELQKLREKRVYPFIDKRIQTSWSSMMIEAFFTLGVYDEKYKELAQLSLAKLLDKIYIDENLMHSSLIEKDAKVEAYLEDYAYISKALIYAYEVCANESYLKTAKQIVDKSIQKYYKDGEWMFSVGEFQTQADIEDGSYPSSVGIIVDSLLSLGTMVDESYREVAFKTLRTYAVSIRDKSIVHSSLTEQTVRYLKEDRIIKAPIGTTFKELYLHYDYPFLHVQYHAQDYYQLCSNSACFSKSDFLPTTNSISS